MNKQNTADKIERGIIDDDIANLLTELSTNSNRVQFFTDVRNGSLWDNLKDKYPNNAHRYKNKLEKIGLIMEESRKGKTIYCLTPLGEAVWEGFIQMAAESSPVSNLGEFFYAIKWHSTIQEKWRIFKGSKVLTDTQHVKKVEGTYRTFVGALTEFKELTKILQSAGDFDDRVNSGLHSEIIYMPDLVKDIRNDDMYLEMARDHEQANTNYYVSDKSLPYQLSIMSINENKINNASRGYRVLSSLGDNDNIATQFVCIWAWSDGKNVLLINNSDEVLEWATNIFENKKSVGDELQFRQDPRNDG